MTASQKTECVVNAAKDQYNLMGMAGQPFANMLLPYRLCGCTGTGLSLKK
ncbi:MAG: hypothetical protein ACLVJZ_07580 [[Clostridium] leptum]